jgi:hypothetical protein
MPGIMDEFESMPLREPDHAAVGSKDLGEQSFETELPRTPDQKRHESMRYAGSMPLIRDENCYLATFPVVADHEGRRGNLNFDAILLGDGDEAAASRRIRIASPDQIFTGEPRIPTPEAEIPRADRKPVQIRCNTIHVALSDRSDTNEMACMCRPALAYIGRERCGHCDVMHVFARLRDFSAGFYRVPLASGRTIHNRVEMTER